jgi:circadian clock protein KaiB
MKAETKLWKFTLYLAGNTSKSESALMNLKRYCEEFISGRYTIEVIDLIKHPQLAEGDQILAIPTLIRKNPAPPRKIIGDLSNREKVLQCMDFQTLTDKTNK